MKKMFIGLLFVILPCLTLSNTATAVEKSAAVAAETVVADASSAMLAAPVNAQIADYDEWVCYYYWEFEYTVWECEEYIIIEYEYYEEWYCIFW